MLLLRIIPSLSLADRKMIDTRELITEARLKCITQRAVSKRKPGYVAGAKPDSLISGNRLCGPHLTGIVRTWLVWEPSLVSHDIHGLRPPRGQHGDPIPFSPSPSPRLFDLRNGEFEYFGKRDSCIFYSLPRFAEDEEEEDGRGALSDDAGIPLQKDHRRVNLWNSTLPSHLGTWWKISTKISSGRGSHPFERNFNHTLTRDNWIIFSPLFLEL